MTKIKQITTGVEQQKALEEVDQLQNQYRSPSTPQPDREEKECDHKPKDFERESWAFWAETKIDKSYDCPYCGTKIFMTGRLLSELLKTDISKPIHHNNEEKTTHTPTPQDAQGEWEERFDNSIGNHILELMKPFDHRENWNNEGGIYDSMSKLKDFIRQELSTQLERLGERVRKEVIGVKKIRELIESYKKDKDWQGGDTEDCLWLSKDFNQSLDLLIQEEKKKV